MFDIGGPELIVIAIIAIIVIGPKELPGAIRTVTAIIRKARGLAAEFRAGLDDIVRETELDDVTRKIRDDLDPGGLENSIKSELSEAIDPDGEFEDALDFEGDWYGPDEGIDAQPSPADGPVPRAAADDGAARAEAAGAAEPDAIPRSPRRADAAS